MAIKRIKMLKPWQFAAAGSIQNYPAPIAHELIRTGRAEEVKEAEAPKAEKSKQCRPLRTTKKRR